MNFLHRLFAPATMPADAARQLGALGRYQYRERVLSTAARMRAEMGLPELSALKAAKARGR